MLFADVFYKFCDIVLGGSVKPAKEDIKAENEEGGNVPVAHKKYQRFKFLIHQVYMIPTKNGDFYIEARVFPLFIP